MLVNWSLFELTSKLTQLFFQTSDYVYFNYNSSQNVLIDHFASPITKWGGFSKNIRMNMVLYYIHPDEYFRVPLSPPSFGRCNIYL
jgi:hypothetical protein